METYLLAFMLALAPGRDVSVLRPLAKAIALTTSDREVATALASIQFRETSFHLRTIYPFGLTCCFNRTQRAEYQASVKAYLADPTEANEDLLVQQLRWTANRTLRIYNRGLGLCGNSYGAFWFFNTGECPTEQPPGEHRRVARARWYRGQHYARGVVSSMNKGSTNARDLAQRSRVASSL